MKADANGRLTLSGRLGSAEVSALYRQSLGWRSSGLPREIDLAAVEHADSSALALLLEWRAWAEQAGQSLEFSHAPRSLAVMASLSHIEDLLGWQSFEFESNPGNPG